MIEFLRGRILAEQAGGVIIDVNGVGYGVNLTSPHLGEIELGSEVSIWIYSHIKEDNFKLFGFRNQDERNVFNKLIEVNRVGPKLALAIMSSFDIATLFDCILTEDAGLLKTVPGVGQSAAQKIILDLKPKL